MLFKRKDLLDRLFQKDEEIRKLKDELADLRVIAGYVVEKATVDGKELRRCDKLTCTACAYSHHYSDGAGGWVVLCTKNSSCSDFHPKSLATAD